MSSRKIFRSLLVVVLLVNVLVLSAQAAPADRTVLHGSAPSWANSANYSGAADPNAGVGFRLYLGWTDPAGAVAFARSVSDPASPSYGQYLTPNQFRQQFAPSANT